MLRVSNVSIGKNRSDNRGVVHFAGLVTIATVLPLKEHDIARLSLARLDNLSTATDEQIVQVLRSTPTVRCGSHPSFLDSTCQRNINKIRSIDEQRTIQFGSMPRI